MAQLTVTVKNSEGTVLHGPEAMPAETVLQEIMDLLSPPPEGHHWSLFLGSVKAKPSDKISDLADSELELNASFSAVADKPPPKAA